MNDKLQDFLKNMGVMCELWLVIFSQFKEKGLDDKAALAHTKSFMEATFATIINGGNK